MNSRNIDIINIGLMLLSCVLAFLLPFELFLFSYIILGPLHYATEINWLHKRNYFTNGRSDFLWLALLTLAVFLANIYYTGNMSIYSFLIFLSFASALAFILFKEFRWKMIFIFLVAVAGAMMIYAKPTLFIIALLIPTIVHVFVFTGLFILQGALKNKSATGIASLVVFTGCALSFIFIFPKFNFYQLSNYLQNVLAASNFSLVGQSFLRVFRIGTTTSESIFSTQTGLAVMRFIAFAYTYHYLNWFSKTSVIKWHLVSKKVLLIIMLIWISCIVLFAYDYKLGFIYLYFFSTLHVFLEFPLNYRSVITIGAELSTLTGLRKPSVAGKN